MYISCFVYVHILTLMQVETEYMPQWFPGGVMKEAKVLSWHSKYSKVIQLVIGIDLLPFLSTRDAIVYGNGFHLPDRNNAFLIRSKSTLDNTCRYCTIPKAQKGVVRMMTESIFYVQLIQKDVISFKMIGRDDLKLKYVPSTLLNYLAQGHLPYDLMRSIKRVMKNFDGSIWDKKMKERGAYYKEIEDKVHVQLEKWDKGMGPSQSYSYGANVVSKEDRLQAKVHSTRNMLPAMIVIAVAAVSIPLLTEDHSMLVMSKYISSVMTKLLESEQFLRIMSVMPTLMLSLASLRKVVELY